MEIIIYPVSTKPSLTVQYSQSWVDQAPGWLKPGWLNGTSFLQDNISITNFHIHFWEAYFSVRALLATVILQVCHSLALCSVEDLLLLNDELQLKWSSLETMEKWPLKLRLYNCFIVLDCAHQSPSQVDFSFLGARIVLMLLRKWTFFHFLSWYYLFSFYCNTCMLWHWKSK